MNKRKHHNTLTIQKRIQILDWLRAHPDDLPNMTSTEIVKAVSEFINHSCSLNQIRQTARAGNMRWQIKRSMPSGKTGSAGRMDKLEARILELERWCLETADNLGSPPPFVNPLPTDEEL